MQLPQSDSEQRALTPTALVDLKCQKNCACSRFREGCRCKYRSDWSCRCGWRACVCQPSARRSRSRSCSRSRSRSRSRSASPTILRCCGNDQGEKDSFLAQIFFTYKCSGCKKNFECWNGKKTLPHDINGVLMKTMKFGVDQTNVKIIESKKWKSKLYL